MMFIKDQDVAREGASTLDASNLSNFIGDEEIQESETLDNDESTSSCPPTPAVKRTRKTPKSDQVLDLVAQSLQSSMVAHSAHEAFGRYVAQRLDSLRSLDATVVRKLINDVLFEAEIGNLTITSRITSDSCTFQAPFTTPLPQSSNTSGTSGSDEQLTQYFTNFQPL